MHGIPHPQEPLLPGQQDVMRELQARGFTTYNATTGGMPKTWVVQALQDTAGRIKARAEAEHDLSSRAIADALFDLASGFSDAACQAIQEAEMLRGMRA